MANVIEPVDLDNYIVTDLVTPPMFFEHLEVAFIQAQSLAEKTGRDFYLFTAAQKFLGEHPYKFNTKNSSLYMIGDYDNPSANPFDSDSTYPYESTVFTSIEEAQEDFNDCFSEDANEYFTPTVYQVTPLFSLERVVKYKPQYL